jgi:hypothetical protein
MTQIYQLAIAVVPVLYDVEDAYSQNSVTLQTAF